MLYNKDNPLTVIELFAGYGSQHIALERIKHDYPEFDYKVLAIAEIDKYALAAYEAIHGDVPNLGSVTDIVWEEHPELNGIGLASYSFPCQDISIAGNQKGFERASCTRSSLLWECEKCFRKLRPKHLLLENVKALTQRKFMPLFQEWLNVLDELGYTTFYQVVNARDMGVPQNRERVFAVSILRSGLVPNPSFEFPKPFPLEKRLRDVLEDNVDESYYLKDEQVQRILAHCERKQAEGCGFKENFTTPDKICGTITGNYGARETDPYLKLYETPTGGQSEPKIIEPAVLTPIRTDEQRELRKQGIDTFGGRQMLPRTDGVANTITTVQKDNLLQEPCVIGYTRDNKGNVQSYHERDVAGTLHTSSGSGGNTDQFVKEMVIGSMQANAMRGSLDGVSPCLTEAMGTGGGQIPMVIQNAHGYNGGGIFADISPTVTSSAFQCNNFVAIRYRIRKLTHRECFRLMGVDDADIDKIDAYRIRQTLKNGTVKETPIPKSQKYKMAGNSIVVDVLYNIFYQMFIAEPPKPQPKQLTLFDL